MTKKEIERLEAENKVMRRALETIVNFGISDCVESNRDFLKIHPEYKHSVFFAEICAKAESCLEIVNSGRA